MQREVSTPRPGWQGKLEQLGFDYYIMDGKAYWNEQACYAFTSDEAFPAFVCRLARPCWRLAAAARPRSKDI